MNLRLQTNQVGIITKQTRCGEVIIGVANTEKQLNNVLALSFLQSLLKDLKWVNTSGEKATYQCYRCKIGDDTIYWESTTIGDSFS